MAATARKTTAKKKSTATKKTSPVAKKTPPVAKKQTAAKAGSVKKYGPKASERVGEELHEMKRGELRSGGSGKKVTNPKQAIAIALSEARRDGAKVPPNPNARKKSS